MFNNGIFNFLSEFKFAEGYYSKRLTNFAFPAYTLIWMFFSFLSGGYDRPFKLLKMIRGVLVGTGFILIIYSLLPEDYRFSRALILLGTAFTVSVYNTIGQSVYTSKSTTASITTIDLSAQPAGVYHVKVSNGNGSFDKAIVFSNK